MPLREIDTLRFSENCRDITPFGSEISSFQGPVVAGSGFSYKFSATGPARSTRNRFIVWRIIGSALELVEHSLDYTLVDNAIRIHFKSPLLNNVCIFEKRDGPEPCVCIFVATQSKTLHRFVFPHPSIVFTTKESSSIFASLQPRPRISKVNHLENICRTGQPTTMSCLNEKTLFFGTSNGTVTMLTMGHPSDVTQTHDEIDLREGSIVSYLWSVVPKTPFSKASDAKERAIVSISCFFSNGSVYVFTFSVDSKLRIWSVGKQQCIHSSDIQFQSWNQRTDSPIVRNQSMQFVAPKHISETFKLVFYLSTANETQFQVFSGLFSIISGQESVTLTHELTNTVDLGEDVVDYLATPSHLWTINSRKEETIIKYCGIEVGASSGLQTNSWNEVFPDAPEVPTKVPSGDLERFFLSKIFEPGRFSPRVISKAIQQFKETSPSTPDLFNPSESSLRRQIIQEVQHQIQEEINRASSVQDITQATADAICESIWKRFMLSCVKRWREEHDPIGLIGVQHNECVCVVKRSTISFVRACEKLESYHLAFSTTSTLENAMDRLSHLSSDHARILLCAYKITRVLGPVSMASFDMDLFYLDNPIDLCYHHVSNLIGGITESSLHEDIRKIQRTFYSDFIRVLRHVTDPVQVIGELLDSVSERSALLHESNVHVEAVDFAESLFGGFLSELVTTSIFRQVVTSRYELIRALALLICTVIRLRSQNGISEEKLNELQSSVSSKAMNLLKSYYVVGWLSNQIEEDLSSDSSADSVESSIAQFSHLEISGKSGFQKGTPASIIQIFFRRNLGNIQRIYLGNSVQLNTMFTRENIELDVWGIFNHLIINLIQVSDTPIKAANVAAFLKGCGQYSMLQNYIRLLDSKVAPLQHLLAETYLHFGQYQKARDCFFQAASALESSNNEGRSTFKTLWPALCSNRDLVNSMMFLSDEAFIIQYYIFISQVFAEQSQHDIVCEFAFAALGSLDQIHDEAIVKHNVPHLWSTIFKHSVEMGNYDQAYQSVTSNPDEVRRLDSLRRFIVVLVENNKLKQLSQYPFVGLTDHVKRILYEKAVYNDITVKPNYYRVSYAYHVAKGNFRQAAGSMYELAQRMSLESYSREYETLQEQAGCYAAAIHALKMVDKKYQWIPKFIKVKGKEPEAPPSPKRKRLELEDNSEPVPPVVSLLETKESKSNLTVVTLHDLEKLFGLLSAQAKLTQRNPKIRLSEVSERDTIFLLTREGLFDTAISLSLLFESNLKTVLETLTVKCLQYQYSPSAVANDYIEHDWFSGSENFQPTEKEGTYWRILEEIVVKYDSRDNNFQYHTLVADKILTLDPRVKLPNWLIRSLKEKNPSSILRIFMKHQLFEDAGYLIVDMLRDVRSKLESKAQSVWLPYGIIDQLLHHIKPFTKGESESHKKLLRLHTDIEEGVNFYLQDVRNKSSRLQTDGMIQ